MKDQNHTVAHTFSISSTANCISCCFYRPTCSRRKRLHTFLVLVNLFRSCSTCPQLHLQRLPQPAHQLPGGVHSLPVQHHRQRGFQHVVRLHHRGWQHAQQVRERAAFQTVITTLQSSGPPNHQPMFVAF